ncbi:outer membrane beta-barrel protein [Spirosoma rigui]|uniref:outer membrane beta-barrel protein n=1 Tax=Spirosoma rigui TaxID=564064 RepID=UPI0009B05877|nr:outer membrane beta-barrel protein [Spirosoma rigui]
MKNYLAGLFMLVALSASAQVYKPFKVNVSVGYAKPLNAGVSGGFLVAVEPKYGLSDHFDLGLRLESAFVARGITRNGNTTTSDVGAFGSYLITGNYLFGTEGIRPFLGAGVGLYSVASGGSVTVQDGQTPQQVNFVSDTKFGGMIRAGIKTGHFVAAVEYNAAPTTDNTIGTTKISSENAYLGVKVGFDIGGGRR